MYQVIFLEVGPKKLGNFPDDDILSKLFIYLLSVS